MEKVALRIPAEKKVTWMSKTHYQKVHDFILDELHKDHALLLQELIERATVKLTHQFPFNLTWVLLRVKQDMEMKGVIKTNLDFLRNQTIMVAHQNKMIVL